MLSALGARFLDADGRDLPDGGGALVDLEQVDLSGLRPPPVDGVDVLSDVDNPLLGASGAAAVFGPQKGATDADIRRLEAGLTRLAELLGGTPEQAGAVAAGGTAYALAVAWDAQLRSGSVAIAEEAGIDRALADPERYLAEAGRSLAATFHGAG